jgi:integrase
LAPQKRTDENKKLPARWRKKHGAYYYRVPLEARQHWDNKSEFRLGKTLAEAHATFAQRVGFEGDVLMMEDLCDRYELEIVPTKSAATQRSNHYSIQRIRKAFRGNRVPAIQPVHLYTYQDYIIKTESVKKAALDHEVLSHMFTCAIRWGVIRFHPMVNKGVVKPSTGSGRKVVPLLQDVMALINTLPRKWQLYVALKVWTGRRKGELLRLKRPDLTDDGMEFTNNKPPYDVFTLLWEPETRKIVQAILQLNQGVGSVYLFHTRTGQSYIDDEGDASGFDSIWQRYRNKAFENGIISVKFTEHDLRKVRASQLSAEQAQELLQHTNPAMTKRYQPKKVVRIEQK